MKKQIKIIMIIAIFLLASIAPLVYAADSVTISLSSDSNTVAPGDTFKVTYLIDTDDDVTGGTVNFEYDESKLTLIDAKLNSNYSNFESGNLNYSYSSNVEEKIPSVELVVFTFQVKADAAEGKAAITAKNNSVELTAGSADVADKTIEVTISENSVIIDPPANNTITNSATNTNTKTNTAANTKTNKDNTKTNKTIPYTGAAQYIFPGIILLTVAGVSYMAYKKNNI